jgi:ATP-dependent RNA circularization protein (DNA/RNA ligase family)
MRRVLDAILLKVFGKTNALPEGFVPGVPKTDETRAETLPYLFDEKWKGMKVYTTVKVDGQSGTWAVFRGKFYIASRSMIVYAQKISKAMRELKPARGEFYKKHGMTFLEMASKYDAPRRMREYFHADYAVQFEQAGPRIQKNTMGLSSCEVFIFNVFDISAQRFLNWQGLESFAKTAGIPTVPFIEKTEFRWNSMDELYAYSKGNYENGHAREGIVIRADTETLMPNPEEKMHAMWSFKVINPDYIC